MTAPQLATRGASLASMMGGGGGSHGANQNFLAPTAQGPLIPEGGVSLRNQMMGTMRAVHDSPRFQQGVGSLSEALSGIGNQYKSASMMNRPMVPSMMMPSPGMPRARGEVGRLSQQDIAALLKYLPLLFK